MLLFRAGRVSTQLSGPGSYHGETMCLQPSGPDKVRTGCAASTTFAGERQLFLPAKGQQRSVAHHLAALGCCRRPVGGRESVSAGAPTGAEAPSRDPGNTGARRHTIGLAGARFMVRPRRPDASWPCRGASRARSGSWGHRIPAAPSDAPGDRSPRPSPSDRERSDPTARRSDCS